MLVSPPHPILPTTRQQRFFNFYCKNDTCQLLVHVQLLRGWDNERTSSNTLSAASQPTLEDFPATTTEPTSQICLPTTDSLTHLADRLVPLLEARDTHNISSYTPVPSTPAVLPSVHTHGNVFPSSITSLSYPVPHPRPTPMQSVHPDGMTINMETQAQFNSSSTLSKKTQQLHTCQRKLSKVS